MAESIEEEIVVLKSIYEDELKVTEGDNCKEISITIYPSTAEDEASKYVCLDASIKIALTYPLSSPEFFITRSRGLSDEFMNGLSRKLADLTNEKKGEYMLFDMLDLLKENLTENNVPSDICSICLSGFESGVEFLKTSCFHYFHRYCMKNYKNHVFEDSVDGILSLIEGIDLSNEHSKITVPCPVCKALIEIDTRTVDDAIDPNEEMVPVDFVFVKKQREKFTKIYQSQLEKGGIIDLEHEKNKFLVSNLQKNYERMLADRAAAEAERSSHNEQEGTSKDTSDPCNTTRPSTSSHTSTSMRHQPRQYRFGRGRHQNPRGGDNLRAQKTHIRNSNVSTKPCAADEFAKHKSHIAQHSKRSSYRGNQFNRGRGGHYPRRSFRGAFSNQNRRESSGSSNKTEKRDHQNNASTDS